MTRARVRARARARARARVRDKGIEHPNRIAPGARPDSAAGADEAGAAAGAGTG